MWHKRVIKTNDKLHWNAYRHFRQEAKREIRLAEKEHFRSEILKSNQKYQFDLEILNRYISRKYTSLTTVQNTLLLANKFNEFYANVGTMTTLKASKLAEEHDFNNHDAEGLDPCESDHNSWPKAVGCDRVNASSPVIAPIIASLINSFTLVLFLFHGRTQKSLQFLSQGTVTSLQTRGQCHYCLFYLKYVKERLICSLPISSILTMSYITCKVEIENFTQPRLRYFTSPMNCVITWIKRRYLLLFFWTFPKLLIAFDTI